MSRLFSEPMSYLVAGMAAVALGVKVTRIAASARFDEGCGGWQISVLLDGADLDKGQEMALEQAFTICLGPQPGEEPR